MVERRPFEDAAQNKSVKFGLNFTDSLFEEINYGETLVTNRRMVLGGNLGHRCSMSCIQGM